MTQRRQGRATTRAHSYPLLGIGTGVGEQPGDPHGHSPSITALPLRRRGQEPALHCSSRSKGAACHGACRGLSPAAQGEGWEKKQSQQHRQHLQGQERARSQGAGGGRETRGKGRGSLSSLRQSLQDGVHLLSHGGQSELKLVLGGRNGVRLEQPLLGVGAAGPAGTAGLGVP